MKTDGKGLDISEIRIRLDQFTEQIVSGLKNRSRFALNTGVFSKEFAEGKTWFLYRLKKEQDLDSEFGRYLFFDQHPLIFSKGELSVPKAKRNVALPTMTPLIIDMADEIIGAYREVLGKICEKREDEGTYGATAKMDVENVLTLNERILGLGEQVAAYKMQKDPSIKDLKSADGIRKMLMVPERKKQLIDNAREIARRYSISDPKAVADFMEKIHDITADVEVKYVQNSLKR